IYSRSRAGTAVSGWCGEKVDGHECHDRMMMTFRKRVAPASCRLSRGRLARGAVDEQRSPAREAHERLTTNDEIF
ncbi:MAG: hypothetical protein WCC78_06430, partial [Terriglobales bacterium]